MKAYCEESVYVDDEEVSHRTEQCGWHALQYVVLPYRGLTGLCSFHEGSYPELERMSSDWDPDWAVSDMDACLFDPDGGGPCGHPAVAWLLYPKIGYFANYGTQDRVAILCAQHAGKHGTLSGVPVTLNELEVMRIMES